MKLLFVYLAAVSLAGLVLMAVDKWNAVHKRRRIAERTLFLVAAIGGSIGVLAAMYLFHHKTRKARFRLGIPVILAMQAAVIAALFYMKLRAVEQPETLVRQELNQIKSQNMQSIEAILSTSDTGEAADDEPESETTLPPVLIDPAEADLLSLFFDHFDYDILSSQIDGNSAEVIANITNIDTRRYAHDVLLNLTKRSADPRTPHTALKTEEYFAIMQELLEDNTYPTATTSAVFHLDKQGKNWTIRYDAALEDALLGGFLSNLQDPYLLSALEVLECYLDAFRQFTAEEWDSYLGISDIFSTYSPDYAQEIDMLYTQKLASYFACEIESCEEHADTATARLLITSIDMEAVLGPYRELLLEYASTTESITDSSVELANAAARYLLEAMEEHAAPKTFEAEMTLHHNGETWIPEFGDEVTRAFLGDIPTALDSFKTVF